MGIDQYTILTLPRPRIQLVNIHAMIYICAQTSKTNPSTNDFIGRGLAKYTVSPVSNVALFGVPHQKQLAYSGYKDNIEAFIYATATKQKVLCTAPHFPIPSDYIPTYPDIFPRTLFGLARKTEPTGIAKMVLGLEKEKISVVVTNQGQAYTLDKPSFRTLSTILPRIAKPIITFQAGYSQVESSMAIMRVYQCIEAFLATNTYSYKKQDFDAPSRDAPVALGNRMTTRTTGYRYRPQYDHLKTKKMKYTEANAALPTRVDDQELADLTPEHHGSTEIESLVLVAKPSPLPATTSYGAPSDVPFVGGLAFPYFPGMLSADSKHIRDVVGRRFFRNLGAVGTDPRDAYKAFRASVNIAAGTQEGIILSHILLGVDQALETQTQLFLLFDGGVYLGFCLLGSEFKVFCHGVWHLPLTAEQLKAELAEITTHDTTLSKLADAMGEMYTKEGTQPIVLKEDIDSPIKLATLLSSLRVTEETDKEKSQVITNLIGRLNFPGDFRRPSADNISWAVRMLTNTEPMSSDTLIFIPRDNWAGLNTREYQILAAFGPRSISFRNSTGTEYRIPANSTESDPMSSAEAKEGKRDFLIVYEKPVRKALEDWHVLVETGRIRVHYGERAVGSRANRFLGDARDKIWRELKSARERGVIGVASEGGSRESVAAVSSVPIADLASGSIDEFF